MIKFVLTLGNVADNNAAVLTEILGGLQGQCFGDRVYLTKLFAQFYEQALQLGTKLQRRMKNTLMKLSDELKLR
uniref:transposase n=1 Tax=Runella zeae TaxID=94255 RepID=UPI0004251056|nr:transposase [Runella zeae]